jgi:3-isopropylmalate/(R)-2-methylmalate dehydratase small subunit
MKGKVIKYDQRDINTDLIIPARYLTNSDPNYLAEHCMEDFDKEFAKRIKEKDFSILVAESNFGCGSSREQAPIALKAGGIQCIIAPSFARIFFRNAINIGLPIIEMERVEKLNTDDELIIDIESGFIQNVTKHEKLNIKKFPSFLTEIIQAGGLLEYAKKIITKK